MIINITAALLHLLVICFVALDFEERGAAVFFAEILFWAFWNSFRKKEYRGIVFKLFKLFGFPVLYALWWAILLDR